MKEFELGMVGLGVMGRNLVLNMADHGYSVAGYDKDTDKVEALRKEAGERQIQGAETMAEFVGLLRTPRAVMILVPAGPPVDSVIQDLLPHLEGGDLIVDGGNSHFPDTDLRAEAMQKKGLLYLGVGISGGASGARHGPSMMPGGPREAYERVRPIFEDIAAHVDGEPCVTYLGPGSAGHYVKMVHNGIEYGLMQLIAETYDLMKRGLGLSDEELHDVYAEWSEGEMESYLIEITSQIFAQEDPNTGGHLIDAILDAAKQKGTGKWTSQDAMDLQAPVPTIDVAVAMRNLSAMDPERESASKVISGPEPRFEGDKDGFVRRLGNALYAAMITTYAQGMDQLQVASEAYGYDLDLEAVARIWRGGCIIRAALLERIRSAYKHRPELPNLLVDEGVGKLVETRQRDLRYVASIAAQSGIPAPALMASLAYFDGYRSAWLPANLIQAQRDFFGSHTYERIDQKGQFHTEWGKG